MPDEDEIGRVMEDILSRLARAPMEHNVRCRLIVEVNATGVTEIAAYRGAIREMAMLALQSFEGEDAPLDGGELIIMGGHSITVYMEEIKNSNELNEKD